MPDKNTKSLLIIFAKHPELGQVKTRLAKEIGPESALTIYDQLLNHTNQITKELNVDIRICYSGSSSKNRIETFADYQHKPQQGNDLGERMKHSFKEALTEGYQEIILIGSDIFELQANHIKKAFQSLITCDVVLGPSKDGGYYLIGMKNLIPNLFENKLWSTKTVLRDTLSDLQGEAVFLLEELNDIDSLDDLKSCPSLYNFLDNHD
ncbi:TIGR04282 family arsenosugar biosynthesis glycosyltransferase [Mangrovimonas aestuarii]|uniref:TIGR04282 family arsenosugar biosynthesis glycosyltransferase n=1 Tax=Mangrovimonas aestuarii TaxID=3018443 RepID=UPI0023790F18|nr:TIGR04282 family arsenosugar biosynthesis glycosyltransferase [Mangrovimonas aestuarii]